MKKIIVIAGPTAVGKTDLSIALAQKLETEIISADSVQIYKKLDIGSAKPTKDEMADVEHHLIDFVDPKLKFSVSEYEKLAKEEIRCLFSQGKTPIIVGGTGLYINSLIYEMDFGESDSDPEFRAQMEALAEEKGAIAVYEKLKLADPEAAERIHQNNVRRVIRALEIHHITGKATANFALAPQKTEEYEVLLIGLTRPREILYDRINMRVDIMLNNGLLDEVKNLKKYGLDDSFQSMQGIGYKEVLAYLDEKITYRDMVEAIKKGSRHYAKRQMTWFKRYSDIYWLDLQDKTTEIALNEILSIL